MSVKAPHEQPLSLSLSLFRLLSFSDASTCAPPPRHCSRCNKDTRAFVQRKVSRLPRFLPLQLLRYKVQQSGQFWKRGNERVKISTIVRFPLDYLDLGHMLDPGCLQARSGERFVYRLYAIVVSKAYAHAHTHTLSLANNASLL